MQKIALAIIFLMFLSLPIVFAVDFDTDISSSDRSKFDEILEPVMKIYNFIKYAATAIAVLFLIFAGITFIMSGNDQGKREQAKTMGTYVVIGLIVIWVAPLVVNYLVG